MKRKAGREERRKAGKKVDFLLAESFSVKAMITMNSCLWELDTSGLSAGTVMM